MERIKLKSPSVQKRPIIGKNSSQIANVLAKITNSNSQSVKRLMFGKNNVFLSLFKSGRITDILESSSKRRL